MDNKKTIAVALGVFVLGGLATMVLACMDDHGRYGQGNKDDENQGMMEHKMGMRDETRNDDSFENNRMKRGGEQGMMVRSEREFIEKMIPHHEEAVVSAKEVIARGGSTSVIKALAEGIARDQEQEVNEMKSWYKSWYGVDYVSSGTYTLMMGTTTSLSGVELDKVFLNDMVKHHMMAIMMAKSVAAHIEHDEIKTLSTAIQANQLAEITTMQNLLTNLK